MMVSLQNLNIKSHILQLDATELAKLIRDKHLTSKACTITFIQHIQTVNPELNAVVEERFKEAMEEAEQCDNTIDQINFHEQPLFGVPISIKESIHVKGMKTTGGLNHRKDLIMSEDAAVVTKLKDAGAIILCKTNTPALCFCHETDNKLYGKTNNARHNKYTAGGSSGGEAALISVGGASVGLASDIGGSIRFPSHYNGVVGFKPGRFQVSNEGHFPPDSIPLKNRMSSIGPIGKSVRDTRLIYQLITKTKRKKLFHEKMIIDILPVDNGYPLSRKTTSLMENVYQYLSGTNQTTWSIPPFFYDGAGIWQEIMSINGAKDIKLLAFNAERSNVWKHYLHDKLTKKSHIHPYLSWALIAAEMFKPSIKRTKEIERYIEQGDLALDRYLHNRLLIFPVYYKGAHTHGELYKEVFSISKTYLKYMAYIAYANVWGLPSLTIPIGVDERQMPIAIQIIGKIGNEEAMFSLGERLENHFGSYARSTYYD